MKKLSTLKTMLAAALLAVGVSNVWADEQPTPVYFNDFSSTDGLTVVGNGIFEDDADARFGKVFHNDPTLTKAIRTNYLLLPNDVLSHSATSKEMTIGVWVNMRTSADFYFSPLFSAYGMSPADNAAAGHLGNDNNWPMFVVEARGLLQVNNDGWCDFGIFDNPAGTSFHDGTPKIGTQYLDDQKWHYFTITLTETSVKIYIDGAVFNSWTIDGTTDGQKISGLFTYGGNYKHICLGGNQAWQWGDPDPAFAFDDFAVYDKALTAEQIKAVMAKKLVYTFDFVNNNGNWPVSDMTDWEKFADGNVTTLTQGDVVLTGIQGSAGNPVRIGQPATGNKRLYVYRDNAIKFTASEGKALKEIVVNMESGDFAFDASNGTVSATGWSGNATEVTFTNNTGANKFISSILVYVDNKDENTIEPVVATEVSTIAALKELADGTLAKLTLNNAKVNGYLDLRDAYYVEDATGAIAVKGTTLTKGTVINGTIEGVKSSDDTVDMNSEIVEPILTVSATNIEDASTTLEGTVMTIADAAVQANYGKLITVENVTITGGNVKTLTDGNNNTIKARDLMGVLSSTFSWPAKASKVTGILIYNVTGWFLLPLGDESIVAYVQPTEVIFDFSDPNFRENIGEKLTDVKGNIYNETFTADGATLQVTGGSSASKIYVDANRGQTLVTYKEYSTMTFRAPEGYAITKIEFTAAGNSNINNFVASSGAIEGMIWTGDAEGVRFQQGGTSYLANAILTLAAKSDATVALAPINYVECATIAAFNALDNGSYAKIMLTDAELISISEDGFSSAWLQDATGGCMIQYSSLMSSLKSKTKLNGYLYAVKRMAEGNVQIKETEDTPNSSIVATELSDYTVVEGTIVEVNVLANMNCVVKITGAKFEATGKTTGTLTMGDASIKVSNGTGIKNIHGIEGDWTEGDKLDNVTIVAILTGTARISTTDDNANLAKNQLLPISIEGTASGISNINAADVKDVQIYNLQGIRLSGLQKGLNIVNGKKVVVK